MPDTNTWLLITALILLLWPWEKDRRHQFQLRRIEKKSNAIMNHLSIEPNPGLDHQIVELASAGKKLEAIQLYRQKTGVGLKEAKEFIESL